MLQYRSGLEQCVRVCVCVQLCTVYTGRRSGMTEIEATYPFATAITGCMRVRGNKRHARFGWGGRCHWQQPGEWLTDAGPLGRGKHTAMMAQ